MAEPIGVIFAEEKQQRRFPWQRKDWEWELMDNEVASGINIFVPVVYGMVRGRSIGRY